VSSSINVAVVSESAARLLFPGRDAVGGSFENRSGHRFDVVGVVADVVKSLQRETGPEVYYIPRDALRGATLMARARRANAAMLPQVRRQLAALAPGTVVTTEWWADTIAGTTAYRNPRFQTLVLSAFAVIALVLIAVGIWTIVSFIAATRARELGIRLAMGAEASALIALLVRQTLVPVVAGLIAGGFATRWFSQLMKAQAANVETRDPALLAGAIVTIVAAATLAAYIPARRGSRVNPIVVLRAE
jgi:hypothetical protein